MKRLSLIDLHKIELKKSMMATIRGGDEIKCMCSDTVPNLILKMGGPSGDFCLCSSLDSESTSTQHKK